MTNDYMLGKVLKIKNICIEKYLIVTGNKLPADITLKNVVILITCLTKVVINFIHKYL